MNKWFVRSAVGGALAVTAGGFLLALVVLLGMSSGRVPLGGADNSDITSVLSALNALVTAIEGALIIRRQPRNAVGWIALGIGFGLGLSQLMQAYAVMGVSGPSHALPGFVWAAWLSQFSWSVILPGVTLLLLLFPSGHLLTPSWRWLAVLALVVAIVPMLLLALRAPLDIAGIEMAHPFGGFPQEEIAPILNAFYTAFLVMLVLSAVGMILRYKRARGNERQQIKWLAYGAALFTITQALAGNSPSGLGQVMVSVAALGFPLALGIAILHYRLYDIDLLIRKTLVYSVLTALLALVYFGGVVLLQRLVGALTGVEQSPLAVVVSTLAIAALFPPLRRRIQDAIDRRFYRKKYNAQQVLAQFALTARDETDLDALTGELARVVQETLQPRGLSVWLSKGNEPGIGHKP